MIFWKISLRRKNYNVYLASSFHEINKKYLICYNMLQLTREVEKLHTLCILVSFSSHS